MPFGSSTFDILPGFDEDATYHADKIKKQRNIAAGCSVLFIVTVIVLSVILILASSGTIKFGPKSESIGLIPIDKSTTTAQTISGQSTCQSYDCIRASNELLEQMDQSAKPCDDFWQYACGGYLKRHPKPHGGTFTTVSDIVSGRLALQLIENFNSSKQSDTAIDKAKRFFSSCMTMKTIPQDAENLYADFINAVGGVEESQDFLPTNEQTTSATENPTSFGPTKTVSTAKSITSVTPATATNSSVNTSTSTTINKQQSTAGSSKPVSASITSALSGVTTEKTLPNATVKEVSTATTDRSTITVVESTLKSTVTTKPSSANSTPKNALTTAAEFSTASATKSATTSATILPFIDERIDDLTGYSTNEIRVNKTRLSQLLYTLSFIFPSKIPFFYAGGRGPLFTVDVGAQLARPRSNEISISQSGLGLGDPRAYYNDSKYEKSQMDYKKEIENIADQLKQKISSGLNVTDFVDRVWNFEKELAVFTKPRNDPLISDYTNYKRYNLSSLNEFCGMIDWVEFLGKFFNKTTINQNTEITVVPRSYFEELNRLVQRTGLKTLKYFFLVRFFHKWSSYANGIEHAQGISAVKNPRSNYCTFITTKLFPDVVGGLYGKKYITNDTTTDVLKMIERTKKIFRNRVKQLRWMSNDTKKGAEKKAMDMLINVGYDPITANATHMDSVYQSYNITDNYMANILELVRKKYDSMADVLAEKNTRGQWSRVISPAITNAFYSPSNNAFYIIAGILASPFYTYGAPRAINFGHVGAVIGHEIIHGFDDSGSKFDSEGALSNWWSSKSLGAFKSKVKCVVDYYSSLKVMNETVNGNQTVGENIADIGGLIEAYYAYKDFAESAEAKSPEWAEKEKPLPGFKGDNFQALFVAFAQNWCQRTSLDALRSKILLNVHAPNHARVVGTIRNVPEFAETFKCPKNSNYNPEPPSLVCDIW